MKKEENIYRLGISTSKPLRTIDISNHKDLNATAALASELNIPIYVLGIYNHWIEVNNKKYYYKQTRAATRIVLEFLGEYISKYMELDTVEYTLATDKKGISGLLSENYRQRNIEYVQSSQLTKDELSYIRRTLKIPLLKRDSLLEEELAKYIMRNFYTVSGDRDGNVICKRTNSKLHLATLYDYECSFDDPNRETYTDRLFITEDNKYLIIDCSIIARLIKKSKIMRDSFEKIMEFNMTEALSKIEDNNGIIIPSSLKANLTDYDMKRKKLMYQKIK